MWVHALRSVSCSREDEVARCAGVGVPGTTSSRQTWVCALLPVPCSREVEVARCARAPGPAAEALGMAMDSAGPTAGAVDTAAETTVLVESLVAAV